MLLIPFNDLLGAAADAPLAYVPQSLADAFDFALRKLAIKGFHSNTKLDRPLRLPDRAMR
jgi:hypothetical protein